MIGGQKCRHHAESASFWRAGLLCYAEIPPDGFGDHRSDWRTDMRLSFCWSKRRLGGQKTWYRGRKILPCLLPLLKHQNADVPVVSKLVNRGDEVSLGTARQAKAIEQVNRQRTHAVLSQAVKASISVARGSQLGQDRVPAPLKSVITLGLSE